MDKIFDLIKDKIPADKAEEIREALAEAFEESVQGLKAKNTELILKMKKLRDSGSQERSYEHEEELENLRSQVNELKAKSEREIKRLQAEKDKIAADFAQKAEAYKRTEADRALTLALSGKVKDPVLLKAVKSMLSSGLDAQEIEGAVKVLYKTEKGPLALEEFIESWSQTDEGKRFVSAPVNTGSGTTGPANTPGARKIARAEYEKMPTTEKHEFVLKGGVVE